MIRTSRAGDVAKQIKRSTCIDGIRIALEDYFLTEKYSSTHSQGTLPVCAAASRLVRLSGSPDEAFRLLVDVWRPSNVYLLERLGLSSRPFLESFKKMGIPGKPLVTRHAIPLLELLQGVKQGSGSTHNQRFSNLALTLALSVKGGPTAGLATALLHCWAVWGPPSSDVVAALDKGGAASPYEPTKIPLVGGSPGVLESFVAAAEPPLPSQPLANPKMWVEAISLMNKFQPPRAEGARVALWLARGGSPVGDPSLTPRGHGRSKLTASEAALSFIGAPIKYDAFHSAERQKKKVFSGALLAGVTSTEKINSLGNVAADPTTLGALSNAERPTLSPQIMRIRDWAAVFSDTLTKKMLQQRGTHDKDGHHENTPSPAEECSIKNKEIMPESALALLSPTHFHPLVDIPCDMSPSARASAAFLRRMHGITFGVLGMKGLPTGGSLPPNSRQGLKSVLGSSGSLGEGTPPPPQKLVTGATLSAILRSAKCPGDVAYVLNLADWLELPLTSGGLLQESVAKLCGWGRSSEAMDLIARMRAEEEEAAAFSRVSDTFTPSRALLEAVSAVIQVCSEAGADAQALSAWAYLCQAAEGGGWRPTPGAVAAAINSSSRCGLVEDMYRCIVWVESGRGYISCDSDSGSDLTPSKGYRLGDLTRAIAATQSPVGASAGYSAQRVPPSAPSIAALADATLAVVSLIEEGMGAAVSKVGDTSGIPSLLSAIPGLPLDERAAASMSGEQPTLPFPPGSYLLPSHRLSPLQWGATTQKGKTTRSGLEQPSLPFVASLLALARCGDGDYVVLLVLRELGRRAAAVERERGRGRGAMAGRGGHEKEEGEEAAVNGAFVRALAMVGDVEGAFSAARAFVRLHAGASPPRGTTLRTRGGKEGARSTAVPYMDLLSVLSAASHLHHLPPVYGVLGLIQEMERERGASDDERVEGPTENDSGGYESRRFRWALPRALLKMSRRIVRVRREEERQKGVQGLMSKGGGALEEEEEEEREGAMLLQQARAILGNFAVGEVGKAGDDIEINGEKTGMPRREEEDEFLHDYKMEEEEEEEGGGVGKGGSDCAQFSNIIVTAQSETTTHGCTSGLSPPGDGGREVDLPAPGVWRRSAW